MYQAKNAIRQQDVCYLVEGYTDVISLHQAGIEPVVASSGTSLTVEQIKLIGRFTANVTILYDGDPAGIKAALRGLDLLLEEGLNVSVVLFPEKHDPDSYVKAVGALAFQEYIKRQAQDFIAFKANTLLQDAGQDPFRRAEVIGEVVQSIIKIPDAIKRQVFFQRTATLMQVDEQMLISEGNKLLLKQQQQKKKEQERAATPSTLEQLGLEKLTAETPELEVTEDSFSEPTHRHGELIYYQEEECIRLLINHAAYELEPGISLCHYILRELHKIDFRHKIYGYILDLFRVAFERKEILSTEYFTSHHEQEIQEEAINLVMNSSMTKYELSDGWQKHEIYVPSELDNLHKAAYENILRLKKRYNELIMKAIKEDLAKATTEEETDSLLQRFMHHKALEKQIAELLGTVISG
jgi:DNA primase